MRVKLRGFDDVITFITIDFTWDKRLHLVSIFHPWLDHMLHADSQNVQMDKLIHLIYWENYKLKNSTIIKDENISPPVSDLEVKDMTDDNYIDEDKEEESKNDFLPW